MSVFKLSFAYSVLFPLLVASTEERQKQINYPKLDQSKITENMTMKEISEVYLKMLEETDKICRQQGRI